MRGLIGYPLGHSYSKIIHEAINHKSYDLIPLNEEEFKEYCHSENVEVTHVADVTDTQRMRMFNGGSLVVDLQRKFIDSAGAKHYSKALIGAV